jgi:hypothetical protein
MSGASGIADRRGGPSFRHRWRALHCGRFARALPDPGALALRLAAIPGVVEHGMFIGLVRIAIIAGPAGVRIVEA